MPRDLYANPLLFTLLAALWLDPQAGGRLPTTLAELYRRAVDLFIARWTRPRLPNPSIAERLGMELPEHLRGVLEALAFRVHAAGSDYEEGFAAGLLEDILVGGQVPRLRQRRARLPGTARRHHGVAAVPRCCSLPTSATRSTWPPAS